MFNFKVGQIVLIKNDLRTTDSMFKATSEMKMMIGKTYPITNVRDDIDALRINRFLFFKGDVFPVEVLEKEIKIETLHEFEEKQLIDQF